MLDARRVIDATRCFSIIQITPLYAAIVFDIAAIFFRHYFHALPPRCCLLTLSILINDDTPDEDYR